jgi:peptidyl-prolyl cis-trans isomerase B (cyclophilin B)
VRRLLVIAALTAGVLALAACGGGEDGDTTTSASGTTGCADVEAPESKPDGGQTKPTEKLDPAKTYVLVLETSCGDFEVTLDQQTAPETSASLVSLANAGFYDGTIVHRVVPGFVVQGGDPTGTGSGGPGYSTTDAPPDDATYTKGVFAMAKTELEPPGTAGSQWFVVTGEDAGLQPDYAIVGEVTSGFETVQAIEALGDVTTQLPSQPVVVERVSVRES